MELVKDFQKKYGFLIPTQAVAKELGVSKAEVSVLIDTGVLKGIVADTKTYISAFDLATFLGQGQADNSGNIASGYLKNEELDCVLTNNEMVENTTEEAEKVVCKGSISTLADGRFMVQIDKGKTLSGKRDRESKGFRDENEAKAFLSKRLAYLNGTSLAPQVIAPLPMQFQAQYVNPALFTDKTFEEYAIKILNEGIGKANSRTIEGYRLALAHTVPHIGSVKMTDIDRVMLRKMFDKLSHVEVKSTLKKTFNTMKTIFEIAYDNGEIPQNPFKKLLCPRSQKVVDGERKPFTDEEIQIVLSKAKNYETPMLYTMFAVLECTGMRPGELRALEWTQFDANNKTVHIVQAISKQYEEVTDLAITSKSEEFVSVTKTAYGVRELHLSDMAVQALIDWRTYLNKSTEAKKNSKFIFPNPKGEFMSDTSVSSALGRFKKKCDTKDIDIYLYRFRHTMCTRLILAGLPIPVIQRIMGDNTPDIIIKVYTHINQQQALAACGDFYNKLNEKHREMVSA